MPKPLPWDEEIAINRTSMRPLYLQIKEALEDWVLSGLREGRLLPGDRMPSENELSEKLGVSSITIKRALDDLRRQGLIQRIQGRGSFIVGQKKITLDLEHLFSLSDLTRSRGMRPGRQTLELGEVAPPAGVAHRLQLGPDEWVARLVRLRLMDKTPVALETSYLPVRIFPDLLAAYNDQDGLYKLLHDRYGHEVLRAEDILEPVLINPFEASALEIPVGSLGLIFQRTGYGTGDQPLEYTKTVFRADACNFSIHYHKEPA